MHRCVAATKPSISAGETELMLDRAGNISARWTSDAPGGLAPSDALIADAERVGRTAVATRSHAGHMH